MEEVHQAETSLGEFDSTLTRIATYSVETAGSDVSEPSIKGLVRHHLDSIGCAYGAFGEPVCEKVRAMARSAAVTPGATVIGESNASVPEWAVFANTAMVRYLDFNDNYLRNGGGHTSDLIPAVLTAAEVSRASPSQYLLAIHVGYEVFAALADAVDLRDRGWDYPLFIAMAAAAAASKAMGLSAIQTANAVAMAVTPSFPLGVNRVGPLSNWKGLASAFAATTGYLATRLAAADITGPPQAIEGHRGFWSLAGGRFDLGPIGMPVDGLSAVERSSFKLVVAEFNAQGPVSVFVDLHRQGVRPDDIESIVDRTYRVAWSEIGGGQDDHDDKWDPQNKETADHSLPYMIAVALTDGNVQASSYSPERIADPELRKLMAKISVKADSRLDQNWVLEPVHEIEVRLRDGREIKRRSIHAKGHHTDPASDDDLSQKFRAQAEPVLGRAETERLLDVLWSLPSLKDLDPLLESLRSRPEAARPSPGSRR